MRIWHLSISVTVLPTWKRGRLNRPRTLSPPPCEQERIIPMHTCRFCLRDDFPSPQSFYAHLRWCDAYKQHKLEQKSAASLRQAVPKAYPAHTTSPPNPPPPMNDLFGPFIQALQSTELRHPETKEVQETAPQRIRRLLQAAKTQAIDHYWSLTKTVTAEMRA